MQNYEEEKNELLDHIKSLEEDNAKYLETIVKHSKGKFLFDLMHELISDLIFQMFDLFYKIHVLFVFHRKYLLLLKLREILKLRVSSCKVDSLILMELRVCILKLLANLFNTTHLKYWFLKKCK